MNLKKAKRLRKQLRYLKVVDVEYEIREMKIGLWPVKIGCEKAAEGAGFEIISYPMKDGSIKRMVAGASTQVLLKPGCRRYMYQQLKKEYRV